MFVCCRTPPHHFWRTLNSPRTRRAACPGPATGAQGTRTRSRTPTTPPSSTPRMAGSTASRVRDRGRPDRWTRVGALPRPILDGFRQKARGVRPHPRQACPDVDGPRTAVLASQEHEAQTVALVPHATSVSVAIATHTGEREARIREVEKISRSLSEGSSGRWNLEP
jgi:hypothetical protein